MSTVAIIGSGISGLICAYLLKEHYNVHLFEANHYLGGHTHTLDIGIEDNNYRIDTGFIVFNKQTYPYFWDLLQKHQIPIQETQMSFSYRSSHFEYGSKNINSLFAHRPNLFKPFFYRFLRDILRFNNDAKNFLCNYRDDMSLTEFIVKHKYSDHFIKSYLVPMVASIWSKNPREVYDSSAYFILQFYADHGLLNALKKPDWHVLSQGSRSYIPVLTHGLDKKIHLGTKVKKIKREAQHVVLNTDKDEYLFDAVVIATHCDQALAILENPTTNEINILSAIPYTFSDFILHTDTSVLPKNPLAWSSWNYLDIKEDALTLTYYMNQLQSISSPHHFCVSINLAEHIAEDKIIKKMQYSHPCFNQGSAAIQAQYNLINGINNTYYAGAYWGHGFHEDGVKSAINACSALGVSW